ncbi:hypothetical protein BDN67DRAFT_968246 [Paxillus ammoniavirescens]|nr:hypothetical protein BDN67DRAFT_968246 [Paxillus ammoniavirescens]
MIPKPTTGDVLLFSITTLTLTNIIRAHGLPLSALAILPSGTPLATASDKGTVILDGLPHSTLESDPD